MRDFLDMLRDFTHLTEKIERDMCQSAKKVQLPDEVDLYNFFERWNGTAICTNERWRSSVCEKIGFRCKSMNDYLKSYGSASQIKYYVGPQRYYAVKFANRGTFLVSERRYKELKSKKGE